MELKTFTADKLRAGDIKPLEATPLVSTWAATKNLRWTQYAMGFSMPQQNRKSYVVYSILLNCVGFFFPVGFVFGYSRLLRAGLHRYEVGLLLTSLQAFANLLACYSKLFTLLLMRRRWRAAAAIIARLDRRCEGTPAEMELQRICVHHCNRCIVFFVCVLGAYSTSTFLGAFVLGQPLYDLYIPLLNWRNSRTQFVVSAIAEYIIANIACFQQVFNDAFPVVNVYILRTHMKILLLRFARLGNPAKSLTENLAELKRCVRDHKNFLELYDIIAPIISKTIFVQFMVTALALSTTLINFTLIANDFYSRVGSFFYIIALICEILPTCYYAQCLKDESDLLPNVIFHSNWIDQDVKFRKMLVFLIQRTQCTKDFMAGKLFPINLSCCLSIVKFSFTLYTFIKTMDLQQKFGMQ